MKKKIVTILLIAILVVLIFPVRNQLKDGGTVEYKAILYKVSKVSRLISEEEMKAEGKVKNYDKGIDCPNCAKKIENKIASMEEYKDVIVNFSTLTLSFKTEKLENVEEDIREIVKSVMPDVNIVSNNKKKVEEVQRNNKDIIRLVIGILIYLLGVILKLYGIAMIIVTVLSVIVLTIKTVKKAYKQLKNKILDENSLIVISVVGACLIGQTMEGVMVIALYEIGKILEARAVNKTRKSISSLMDIKPEYANIKIGEDIKEVSPEEVNVGDIIVVKSGEKIPLDGEVIKGNAQINNSALTGESKLIDVKKGMYKNGLH